MATLNVTQAAKAAGVSRTTFYKHIKDKGISYVTDEEGHKLFDPAELLRHYGTLNGVDAQPDAKLNTVERPENTLDTARVVLLEQEIAFLKRERDTERERRQESEAERHRLIGIIEKQTHLLAAPKEDHPPESRQPKKGFLRRMLD